MGMDGQGHVPADLPPGKPRGLASKPVWTGVGNLATPGFYPWTVLAVESCYTHYTIPARTGSVPVGFMVDKMTLGWVSLRYSNSPTYDRPSFEQQKLRPKFALKNLIHITKKLLLTFNFELNFELCLQRVDYHKARYLYNEQTINLNVSGHAGGCIYHIILYF